MDFIALILIKTQTHEEKSFASPMITLLLDGLMEV